MTQLEKFVLAPKLLIAQNLPPDMRSAGGIELPNARPTQLFKCLRVGPGFTLDVKPGDTYIVEKQDSITIDKIPSSVIHEKCIFIIIPEGTVGSKLERLIMTPKHVLAKLIVNKGSALVQMPTTATSFWEIVRTGGGYEIFPDIAVGDQIAPKQHAAVEIDGGQYGIIHEDWIYGRIPREEKAA